MKARADAKLKTLPDALQEELFQVLRANTVANALVWLEKQHGVKSSPAAASEFFSWYPRQGWLKQAATFASSLEATVRKLPQLQISAEQASSVAQVAFELQAAQNKDAKLFLALKKQKREERKVAIDERKIALLEKKAAQADAAKETLGDKTLTEEERAAKLRGIFQMG